MLFLVIPILFSCKEDREEEMLVKMAASLSKDWQLHSIKIIEPAKFKRIETVDDCSILKTWSFKKNGFFNFKEEFACNPYQFVHAGSWKIESGKFLRIVWQEIAYGQPGGEMKFLIEEVSADSLKLNLEVNLYDEDIKYSVPGVKKYSFTRK